LPKHALGIGTDLLSPVSTPLPQRLSPTAGNNPHFSGTCFRIRYRDRLFIVTARHCIDGRHIDLSKALVDAGGPERSYLPLAAWHLLDVRRNDTGGEDTDRGDIAVFEVDLASMTDEEIHETPALEVERYVAPSHFYPGHRLLVEGYPSALQEMDYDQHRWVRDSRKIEARYDGPSQYAGISRLSYLTTEDASTLDGFSGAPVFAFEKVDASTARVGFVGMMIRVAYFIRSEFIVAGLDHVAKNAG
jgi:hypothetical protein